MRFENETERIKRLETLHWGIGGGKVPRAAIKNSDRTAFIQGRQFNHSIVSRGDNIPIDRSGHEEENSP